MSVKPQRQPQRRDNNDSLPQISRPLPLKNDANGMAVLAILERIALSLHPPVGSKHKRLT